MSLKPSSRAGSSAGSGESATGSGESAPIPATGPPPSVSLSVVSGLLLTALLLGGCEGWNRTLEMGVEGAPEVPPVRGLGAGEEILFLHTEASDPEIADILTEMMRSPVLLVPELARVDESLLADVYVFANGLQPDVQGPLGYQADVFDCLPGEACYSPLRRVNLATWSDGARPRILRSVEEVRAAVDGGELSLEQPGVVVNMPIIRWPAGER